MGKKKWGLLLLLMCCILILPGFSVRAAETTAVHKSTSVTVYEEGYLGINFYFSLPTGADTSKWSAQIGLKDKLEDTQIGFDQAKNLYFCSYRICSAQMSETVYVKLKDNSSGQMVEFTDTVKSYATKLLQNTEHKSFWPIATAMLNYGSAAQTYFAYQVNDLANGNLTAEQKKTQEIPGSILTAATGDVSASLDNISYYGASLLLRDEVSIRLYFKLKDAASSDVSVSVDRKNMKLQEKNGLYYVEISSIPMYGLLSSYSIEIKDGQKQASFEYAPMSYVAKAMSGTGTSQNLKNLLTTMYQFGEQVKAQRPVWIFPQDMVISVGERQFVKVVNSTNNNAVFSMENGDQSICQVDGEGEVIGNEVGTARVVVKVGANNYYCNVNVLEQSSGDGDNSNEEYSYLSAGEKNLRRGDNASLTVNSTSKLAGHEVTWYSTDESIASAIPWNEKMDAVDGFSGTEKGDVYIVARNAGDTTIVAEAEINGEKVYGKCDIHVANSGIECIEQNNRTYSTDYAETEIVGLSYGMNASGVLNQAGLEKAAGASDINHPSGTAIYEKNSTLYLVMTDAWNNRVLVYSGSDIKNAVSKAPAVLGQKDANTTSSGYGMAELSWPMDCAIDSQGRLYVADTRNNRVQVFNDVTAVKTGTEADASIGWINQDHSNHNNHIQWPWAVSTDYEGKLIVTNTAGCSVLIWNTMPENWASTNSKITENYPDLVLKFAVSTTPRTITWSGKQLIIGDENAIDVGNAMYVFNGFPTKETMQKKANADSTHISITNNQEINQTVVSTIAGGHIEDFMIRGGYGEGAVVNGRLYIPHSSQMHTWSDGYIDSSDDNGDLYTNQCRENNGKIADGGYFYFGGGINKVISLNGMLISALHNANTLVYWNANCFAATKSNPSLKEYQDTSYPEILIKTSGTGMNLSPVTDGKHLVVLDDINQRIDFYKSIPTSDCATPDFAFSTPYEIGDAALHDYKDTDGVQKTAFVMSSRTQNILYIWKNFDFNNPKTEPDIVLGKNIGDYYLNREMEYVEFDGDYLYFTTHTNGEYVVLIYKGLPDTASKPIGMIKGFDSATQISSNAGKIAVTKQSQKKVLIYTKSLLATATENKPVILDETNTYGIITSINIGIADTGEHAGENTDQGFNYFEWKVSGQTIARYERTTFSGLSGVLLTEDGKLAVCEIQDGRVIVWNSVDGAINGTETPVILGHGLKFYEKDDTIGTYAFHEDSKSISAGSICMPLNMAYDGRNLWVGEFKFGNRLLRYRVK